MHLSDLPGVVNRRSSLITTPTPFDKSRFALDVSGVSGFFGGLEAISAMATVHIYKGRRWLGWYNTPGSYQIARQYGLVAKSTVFKAFFPGVRTDPARLFEFDGWQGPRFQAVSSGTVIDTTGHLASVLMKECAGIEGKEIDGRKALRVGVTIVRLGVVPPEELCPERIITYSSIFAVIPIAASLSACIASGIYKDWFSSFLILWGILSNGISCLVIGSGTLCFTHHMPANGSPSGNGILGIGKEFVLLQGEEGAVNSVTLGKFSLKFPGDHHNEYIGLCSLLLTIQFIAQLFLIPLASLFGQIMFVSSLGVSWIYNLFLSALDQEKIQRRILLNEILQKPSMYKYYLPSRTAAVVFALCVLRPENPSKILNAYLPNDTKVWKEWKKKILDRLASKKDFIFSEEHWRLSGYNEKEKGLLCSLYSDAKAAYKGYKHYKQHGEKPRFFPTS